MVEEGPLLLRYFHGTGLNALADRQKVAAVTLSERMCNGCPQVIVVYSWEKLELKLRRLVCQMVKARPCSSEV